MRIGDALRGQYRGHHPIRTEFRDYQLIKLTGWTFQELDEQSAVRCDWLLAIDAKWREEEGNASRGEGG